MLGSEGPGVISGLRPPLLFGIWVRTETSPITQSRLSMDLNCQFVYGSMDISQAIRIGWVVSRLSSGSVCSWIQCSCFCCLIIVFDQNRLNNIQKYLLITLQVATLTILESTFGLLCFVFRSTKTDNSSVLISYICQMPWLRNVRNKKSLRLHGHSLPAWGRQHATIAFDA